MTLRIVLAAVLVTVVLSAAPCLALAGADAATPVTTATGASLARNDGGDDIPTWPFAVGTIAAVAVVALSAARRGR